MRKTFLAAMLLLAPLVVIAAIDHEAIPNFNVDATPPSTVVQVCSGPLPSLSLIGTAQNGCTLYTISSTDRQKPDYLDTDDWNTFRHVYYVSGDPACIGTGKPLGSGRDCGPNQHLVHQGQSAYIAQGWALYGVTGGSCSEYDVPLCQGPFCV